MNKIPRIIDYSDKGLYFKGWKVEPEEVDKYIYDLEQKVNNTTINGKTVEEIIDILNGLNIEKITEIEMVMKNLQKYYEWLQNDFYDNLAKIKSDLNKNMKKNYKVFKDDKRNKE